MERPDAVRQLRGFDVVCLEGGTRSVLIGLSREMLTVVEDTHGMVIGLLGEFLLSIVVDAFGYG